MPHAHYLIHTPYSPLPYHTSLPFLAAAYRAWGHRVDAYPRDSLYIREFMRRESKKMIGETRRRAKLMCLWAGEVVRREAEGYGEGGGGEGTDGDGDEGRVEGGREGQERGEIQGMQEFGEALKDFFRGLVKFDKPTYKYRQPFSPGGHIYSNPPDTPTPLAFYIALLSLVIVRNARKPRLGLFASTDHLDCARLLFMHHRDKRREHLYEAMKFAVESGEGRMGEMRWTKGGTAVVQLWVRADGGDESELTDEEVDLDEALPVYEREGEGELPPPYEEVVVVLDTEVNGVAE